MSFLACVSPHPLETDAIILAPRPAVTFSEPMEIETISHPSHSSTPGEVRITPTLPLPRTHTHTLPTHQAYSHRHIIDSDILQLKYFQYFA